MPYKSDTESELHETGLNICQNWPEKLAHQANSFYFLSHHLQKEVYLSLETKPFEDRMGAEARLYRQIAEQFIQHLNCVPVIQK